MDIYATVVKKTEESFSDCHSVKRRLNWWKNYFRQELLSWALDGEIRLGLVCIAGGFRFFFPCTEVVVVEDALPMKSLRMSDVFCCSVVVPSKAARCRFQLPGQTCVPLWT